MHWPAPVSAVVLALAVLLLTAPVLRRLPEPPPDQADGKPTYASLATRRFTVVAAAAAFVAGLCAFSLTPAPHWVAWVALAGVNVVACAIDARTTWLPALLSRAGWVVAAAGAVVVAVVDRSWTPLVAAAVGALVAGGFFHLFWLVTGGIGYGDVRLAATIGAVTALGSVALVGWSLLLGTVVGAVAGVVHRVVGGDGAFPYGPSLLAGPFLALVLGALVPGAS